MNHTIQTVKIITGSNTFTAAEIEDNMGTWIEGDIYQQLKKQYEDITLFHFLGPVQTSVHLDTSRMRYYVTYTATMFVND